MQMSDEFKRFAEQFFAEIMEEAEDVSNLVEIALRPIRGSINCSKFASYLDGITSDSISGDELCKLWQSSPADIIFYDGEELRTFLRAVRDRL